MGRSAEAIYTFRQALAVDPADAEAARDAAIVELTRENYPDTVAFARQALQINQNDALAHDLLGLGLGYQSHFDEAIPEFQRAVQLSPADVDFQQHLAAAERNLHRH
jgi:tetratricopeptide (TPR) repeat protein